MLFPTILADDAMTAWVMIPIMRFGSFPKSVCWKARWSGLIHIATNCFRSHSRAHHDHILNDDEPSWGYMTSRRCRYLISSSSSISSFSWTPLSLMPLSSLTSRLPSRSVGLCHLVLELFLLFLTLPVSRQLYLWSQSQSHNGRLMLGKFYIGPPPHLNTLFLFATDRGQNYNHSSATAHPSSSAHASQHVRVSKRTY